MTPATNQLTPSLAARPRLNLLAPLSGIPVRLEDVPDPVFSQRMVGDGLAIDPLDGVLRAPCDGEVTLVHHAGHAVTMRAAGGVEVLLHIGLHTVGLKGKGFSPKVRAGDAVTAGTPLIEFDLDFIATHAKSAMTIVVVTSPGATVAVGPTPPTVVGGRDVILTVDATAGDAPPAAAAGREWSARSEAIRVPNLTGLHARPSAVLATAAKAFRSDVSLLLGDRRANARSVTSIMSLDARQGAEVTVVADGPDATEAVAALGRLIEGGLGDEAGAGPPPPAKPTAAPPAAGPSTASSAPADPNLITGVAASPGVGVGALFRLRRPAVEVTEDGVDPDGEQRRLDAAIARATDQLATLGARMQAGREAGEAAIFAAHAELLADPDLVDMAADAVATGKTAAFAWRSAFQSHAARLAGMPNLLLAQRATDVRDVGERVLGMLAGVERRLPQFPPDAVLVAEDLTPSEAATLDPQRVAGFCTTGGGATSHVAILARSMGIPALAGVDGRVLDVADGTPAILDADRGLLRLNPSAVEMDGVRGSRQAEAAKRADDLARAAEPAVTTDGHRVEVAANVGSARDAGRVVAVGGDGIGLVRSEFLFMDRATAPTEAEQLGAYKEMALAIGPDRPLVIRTLDVGGDKPLAYLPIAAEDNPFLGERGVRVSLGRPDVLRTQVRAILAAAAFGRVRIMLPMVATLGELRGAKAIVAEEAARLGVPAVPVGIMVEVPAAAVMARQFAAEADFFSVGTNDLTQYVLAMDRGHPKLAPLVDGLNPAVLRLIELTVEGARAHQKWVGVCGGMAGDAAAVPLLVGLGVDELSVSIPTLPAVKAQVRSLDRAACRRLATDALACGTAADVRALVARFNSHLP